MSSAAERIDALGHVGDLVVGELGKDRQRDHLRCRRLGHRKRAGAEAEVCVGVLEMDGYRVVSGSANTALLEVRHQSVTLSVTQHVQMKHVLYRILERRFRNLRAVS